jgi:hypothetical protein
MGTSWAEDAHYRLAFSDVSPKQTTCTVVDHRDYDRVGGGGAVFALRCTPAADVQAAPPR